MNWNWTSAIAVGIGLGALLAPAAAGAQQRLNEGMGGRPETPASSTPIAVRPAPAAPRVPMPPPTPMPPGVGGTRPAMPAGPAVSHHFRPNPGGGVIYAVPPPVVYYPAPGASYGAPLGYDPMLAAQPGALDPAPLTSMVDVPPPSSSSRVIEYPTGRYELAGDGVDKPFTWVWIPAAPPPPPAAPPSARDAAPPTPAAKIYRWVDDQRIVHFTDNPESVPEKFRAQVKQPAE